MVDELTLVFGVAGIVGSSIAVLVAVLPRALEWYYERVNRPLWVEPVKSFLRVNPTTGTLIRFRVHNRIQSAISVQVSPATRAAVTHDSDGTVTITGALFANPDVTVFPTNERGWSFWLPGHDAREVEIHLPIRPGVLRGKETVEPYVFASRFRAQQVKLGPYEVEVDPSYV
jgi:hypothetical protein